MERGRWVGQNFQLGSSAPGRRRRFVTGNFQAPSGQWKWNALISGGYPRGKVYSWYSKVRFKEKVNTK